MMKKWIQNAIIPVTRIIILILVIVTLGKLAFTVHEKRTEFQMKRKVAVCPSLLSISRSARDTLIVMKAESLCNEYVLETLQ